MTVARAEAFRKVGHRLGMSIDLSLVPLVPRHLPAWQKAARQPDKKVCQKMFIGNQERLSEKCVLSVCTRAIVDIVAAEGIVASEGLKLNERQ